MTLQSVPTAENLTGNFNNDQFGVARSTPLTNPYSSTGKAFQCQADKVTPLAVDATGNQVNGTDCSVIPDGLKDPVGSVMVSTLYPATNVANNAGFNFASVPVRKLDEKEFDGRLDHNFSTK